MIIYFPTLTVDKYQVVKYVNFLVILLCLAISQPYLIGGGGVNGQPQEASQPHKQADHVSPRTLSEIFTRQNSMTYQYCYYFSRWKNFKIVDNRQGAGKPATRPCSPLGRGLSSFHYCIASRIHLSPVLNEKRYHRWALLDRCPDKGCFILGKLLLEKQLGFARRSPGALKRTKSDFNLWTYLESSELNRGLNKQISDLLTKINNARSLAVVMRHPIRPNLALVRV